MIVRIVFLMIRKIEPVSIIHESRAVRQALPESEPRTEQEDRTG